MSLWHMAWSYLWNRKLTTSLTILSVALAVGLITSVLTLREETKRRFEEEGQAFDMVIGAKGSPLQLVLSSVYLMDQPTGNISRDLYRELKADEEYVEAAYPINMGDSYRGFRLVGTTRDLFNHTWESLISGEVREPFTLADGRYFDQPFEAVVGALAARQTGLKVGDTFRSTHGLIELPESMGGHTHPEQYEVVGILEPSSSPYDRAIFCDLKSVWQAHAHGHHKHGHGEDAHQETESGHSEKAHAADTAPEHEYREWGKNPEEMITAVLVQLQSPLMRFQYKAKIRETTNAMAAIPINEIRKLYDQLLGTAKLVLLTVGYLVVVISALSILIGLYLSIIQRKRDLAIMRALGASKYEVFGAVLIEAFWVTVLGIACGWLLGNLVAYGLGLYLARNFGLAIQPFTTSQEQLAAFATVAVVGILAGILPAWQAYRSDIARDLAAQ